MEDWQSWLPMVLSGGSLVGVFYMLKAQKRNVEADTSEVLSRAASGLTGSYEAALDRAVVERGKLENDVAGLVRKVKRIEDEVAVLRAENAKLHRWAKLLWAQVVESGNDPVPFEVVDR